GTAPTKGTVTISGTTATYVPTAGAFGADSFTYTATGPGGASQPATVTVTIATPGAPTAGNASADVAFGSTGQAIALTPSGVFT
ncbi:Ig-like domain-containing protein, partial [Escherichia coli]|uniref:Ig-like domain-containing protein n=1 Tax=Escherichia coli TaxID=562 RepID=UPI003CE87596